MLRYLNPAFWAGPKVWGIGRIPWNALAVSAAVAFGFGEHSIWFAGLGAETLYLLALASNPRFQNYVDSRGLERIQEDNAASREAMLKTLSPITVNKYRALEKKVVDIERLYRLADTDDYLLDNNIDALKNLMLTYLRLFAAQRSLFTAGSADEKQVRIQIDAIEKALLDSGGSETLRRSREATLALLQQRLRNLGRREDSLAEIASDLTRIETQIDLALEEASMKGKPQALSAHLEFVSQLLLDQPSGSGITESIEPLREVEH